MAQTRMRLAQVDFPAGTVTAFAATTAPTGWLLCYGQAVSRTTYAALFAVISTAFGVGDNSTTFNLPDLRGRVIAGEDDMGGSSANRLTAPNAQGINGDTFAATGGEEAHAQVVAELAVHNHGYTSSSTITTGNYVSRGSAATSTRVTDDTGSGTAMNVVQPTIIMSYIIKT